MMVAFLAVWGLWGAQHLWSPEKTGVVAKARLHLAQGDPVASHQTIHSAIEAALEKGDLSGALDLLQDPWVRREAVPGKGPNRVWHELLLRAEDDRARWRHLRPRCDARLPSLPPVMRSFLVPLALRHNDLACAATLYQKTGGENEADALAWIMARGDLVEGVRLGGCGMLRATGPIQKTVEPGQELHYALRFEPLIGDRSGCPEKSRIEVYIWGGGYGDNITWEQLDAAHGDIERRWLVPPMTRGGRFPVYANIKDLNRKKRLPTFGLDRGKGGLFLGYVEVR